MQIYFKKIKDIRKKTGLSVKYIVNELNITRKTYWNWENGQTIPSESMIKSLANILKTNVDNISNIPSLTINKDTILSSIAHENIIDYFEDTDKNNDILTIQNSLINLDKKINEYSLIFNSILYHTNNIIYIKDHNQKYIIASKYFLNVLNIKSNYNIKGMLDIDFLKKYEANENTKEDAEVLLTGTPIINKEKFIFGTKKQKWGLFSKIPIYDSYKNVIGILGIIVDITTRKEKEEYFTFLKFMTSNLSVDILLAKDIDKDINNPFILKNIIYSTFSNIKYTKSNIFWGDDIPNLNLKESIQIWERSMTDNAKKIFSDFKKNIKFPTLLKYNLISPITKKEVWITEKIIQDEKTNYLMSTISYSEHK